MKKTSNKKSAPAKPQNGRNTSGKSNGKSHTTAKTNGKNADQDMDTGSALKDFFVDGLKDLYWAEKHLLQTLPKMAKAATSPQLQQAFEKHLTQTEEHVTKLEEVFHLLDEKPQAKKCDGIAGLTKEGDKTIEDTKNNSMTRDAALIIAAQKVEHYEIASYGGLTQLAHTMGNEDAARLLGEIFQQEKEADAVLTEIAESSVNEEALHEA